MHELSFFVTANAAAQSQWSCAQAIYAAMYSMYKKSPE